MKRDEETIVVSSEKNGEGVQAPRLVASWNLEDLEYLVSREYGFVIAQCNGLRYRVVPGRGSLLDAAEFVTLTHETLTRISNRSLALNRQKRGKSWQDTSLRPAFKTLENRLRSQIGACDRDEEIPVFTFFVSTRFDDYLVRKQLGVLAALNIDLKDPLLAGKNVTTVGSIRLVSGWPAYLIRKVLVGKKEYAPHDPEAVLADHSPV